jgi:hypothetical protein
MASPESCPLSSNRTGWLELGKPVYLFGANMPEECLRCVEAAFVAPAVLKTTELFDLPGEEVPRVCGEPNYDMYFGISLDPERNIRNGVHVVEIENSLGEVMLTESETSFEVVCQQPE